MVPPGGENKVMHAQFQVGDTTVMASDGRCGGKPKFDGFALSLTFPTTAEAERPSPRWPRAGRCRCR